MNVSIPHSGHPSFRPALFVDTRNRALRFPSRIRATPHSDSDTSPCSKRSQHTFPSRIRATPHSDMKEIIFSIALEQVSIPHSGHPSFRPEGLQGLHRWASVSIPHSGHPSFRHRMRGIRRNTLISFHPAFGPPLIQTLSSREERVSDDGFPSRIRATPHSDIGHSLHYILVMIVSIPHSGHPSFRPGRYSTPEGFHPKVSIPHSGHPSFRRGP